MKIRLLLLFCCLIPLMAIGQEKMSDNQASDTKGMVKITIMYPNSDGKTFDMEYYSSKHMPMLANLFGDALKRYEIDKGISGRSPEEPLPFLAIGYLFFESVEAYNAAFGPNAKQILGDIPNYTNIQPTVQISKVIH